ncbi:MAG TPA: G1 family glutamic endopeptidase [Streptosporangiaceae bacterium]|nr:G1 family glutamic endopeptidase [Streptosporangiaceae bacterium]
MASVTAPQPLNTVTATFHMPAISCKYKKTPSGWVAHWVGLDGAGNSTVEQAGVYERCINGEPDYRSVWEMYPAPPVLGFDINPGDRVTASVTTDGNGEFILEVDDSTSRDDLDVEESCASTCPGSTAEVITEGPKSTDPGSDSLGLAYFSKVYFTSISMGTSAGTVTDTSSCPANWHCIRDIQVNGQGDILDHPGEVNRYGYFSNFWTAAR